MTLPFKNIRTLAQLAFRIFIRPVFPFGQWLVFRLGLAHNPTVREDFPLGYLKDDIPVEAACEHLKTQGFYMNRVAYFDPGQVLSMRRLDDDRPYMQYHLRVFDDGQVCGHYEYTPEDKPWKHLRDEILEPRTERFAPWVQGIIK